jgi:hypothetical protein
VPPGTKVDGVDANGDETKRDEMNTSDDDDERAPP